MFCSAVAEAYCFPLILEGETYSIFLGLLPRLLERRLGHFDILIWEAKLQ